MKTRINILISAVVFAATISGFVYFVKSKNTNPEAAIAEKAKWLENKQMPDNIISDLETGQNLSAELGTGDALVIYMLSTCEACKKEAQMISEGRSNIKGRVFGVMFEDENTVKKYIKDHDVKFPVLVDKDKKLLNGLSIQYFPANLKLKDGVIQKALFGAPQTEEKFNQFIQGN